MVNRQRSNPSWSGIGLGLPRPPRLEDTNISRSSLMCYADTDYAPAISLPVHPPSDTKAPGRPPAGCRKVELRTVVMQACRLFTLPHTGFLRHVAFIAFNGCRVNDEQVQPCDAAVLAIVGPARVPRHLGLVKFQAESRDMLKYGKSNSYSSSQRCCWQNGPRGGQGGGSGRGYDLGAMQSQHQVKTPGTGGFGEPLEVQLLISLNQCWHLPPRKDSPE